jgi:hypothetical protein
VVEPQRYLDESVQRPVLALEGRGAPGDIGAIRRLRREFGLRGIDAGDMEHERYRPTGRGGHHQRQRVTGPQVEPLGQGERDVDLAGPAGIRETAGKNLPSEPPGSRFLAGGLDDARGRAEY